MAEASYPENGAVLVFGGSGGVGSAICEVFAQAGCPVAFTWFSGVARAEGTASTLAATGVEFSSHRVDVRDRSAIEAVVTEVVARYGGIHSVVCASGHRILFENVADVSESRWRHNFDVDLHGTFHILQLTIPHLRKSRGSFTALSTLAAHRVIPQDAISSCAKAAVEMLVRQVASEEGIHGVRANTVALGAIHAGMGDVNSDSFAEGSPDMEAIGIIMKSIRLGGRPGTAREVADTVAFLASARAAYITGQTIVVDGGATI